MPGTSTAMWMQAALGDERTGDLGRLLKDTAHGLVEPPSCCEGLPGLSVGEVRTAHRKEPHVSLGEVDRVALALGATGQAHGRTGPHAAVDPHGQGLMACLILP